jgi:hypothetical protein
MIVCVSWDEIWSRNILCVSLFDRSRQVSYFFSLIFDSIFFFYFFFIYLTCSIESKFLHWLLLEVSKLFHSLGDIWLFLCIDLLPLFNITLKPLWTRESYSLFANVIYVQTFVSHWNRSKLCDWKKLYKMPRWLPHYLTSNTQGKSKFEINMLDDWNMNKKYFLFWSQEKQIKTNILYLYSNYKKCFYLRKQWVLQ